MMRWILPLALLCALVGYFGPWIDHRVAGLIVTGLDFGEYVKFLPAVRTGAVTVWRAGFYAPLVAIGASALAIAYRTDLAFKWWLRFPLLALAAVAALNLVPPAWTPARLLDPEFRLQTTSLVLLLFALACAPFVALLPRRMIAALVTMLGGVAIVAPLHGFVQLLPAIRALYNQPLAPGWGLWLMVIALSVLILLIWRLPGVQAGKQ